MFRPIPTSTVVAVLCAATFAPISPAGAQQSDLFVSPFVSFLPSAGVSPLAGLALTLAGNGGFGLRASGHMAMENANSYGFGATGTYRPWGADADVMLFIGRGATKRSRTFAPYVFAGIGTAGGTTVARLPSATIGATASAPRSHSAARWISSASRAGGCRSTCCRRRRPRHHRRLSSASAFRSMLAHLAERTPLIHARAAAASVQCRRVFPPPAVPPPPPVRRG